MSTAPKRTVPLSELQRQLKEVARLADEVASGTIKIEEAVVIMMQPPHNAPTEGFARRLLLKMLASEAAYNSKLASGENPRAQRDDIPKQEV
jgi:hypothetical protein